ncbi:transcriptional regulator [Candidatus Accumulibacter sp. ACC007]|uniref:helix-turn-helix transcriptional regulator n=1 Tax=Candidatus Accumulibacter sp. ACC007 TaxID=2823333 RepID=UPI0025C66FE0|nr:transcriptional regulator [Candidatus Accumulibacter sp. ACC007]
MAQRTIPHTLSSFNDMPEDALIDVFFVALLFGCSANTIWRRSRTGAIPKPVYPSPQQTRWRVGDVRGALRALTNSQKVA